MAEKEVETSKDMPENRDDSWVRDMISILIDIEKMP